MSPLGSQSWVSITSSARRLSEGGFPDNTELRRVDVPVRADAEVVGHVLVAEEETGVAVAAGRKLASLE